MMILAVNPWVYDFAYFDLYAKPYGLMMLCTDLINSGHEVSFIDLLDPGDIAVLRRKDGSGHVIREVITKERVYENIQRTYYRFGLSPDQFRKNIAKTGTPDIIFVTSFMTYWYPGVRDTIMILKDAFPDIPVVLGGIYASLLPGHAKKHTVADYVIPGDASDFMNDRFRISISAQSHFPRLEMFYHKLYYIPILTSKGCPFNCAYCASKELSSSFTTFEPEGCIDYLKRYSEYFRTDIVAFYDDALLYHSEHITAILEGVIREKIKLRFYTPNGLHVRFIDEHTAHLLKISGFKKLRLSLEFVNTSHHGRCDQKTDMHEFERAMSFLKKAGYGRNDIGVYLLCGMYGQNTEDLKSAVDYVYAMGGTPYLSEYSPVPGAAMFNADSERSQFDLREPLWHNNSIFPMQNENFSFNDFIELKNYNRKKRITSLITSNV